MVWVFSIRLPRSGGRPGSRVTPSALGKRLLLVLRFILAWTYSFLQKTGLALLLLIPLSVLACSTPLPLISTFRFLSSPTRFARRARPPETDPQTRLGPALLIAGRRFSLSRRRHRAIWRQRHLLPVTVNYTGGTPSLTSRRRYSSASFLGAVLDSGAAKSCIGTAQARAYSKFCGRPLDMRPPTTSFVFGATQVTPLGIVDIMLDTPGGPISIPVHVVDAAVPFLLGADILDGHGLYIRNTTNELVGEGWTLPFLRSYGHYFLGPNTFNLATAASFFSTRELKKLHRHLRHPSPTRMFSLLQSASAADLPVETLAMIRMMVDRCEQCNTIRNREVQFSHRLKGKIIFNRKLQIDLLYLDGRPVLHVVDTDTGFGNAGFIGGASAAKVPTASMVWQTFLQQWVHVYTGHPDVVQHDRGTNLDCQEFRFLCATHGIETRVCGVESHHGNGQVERAHHPLRQIYTRLMREHPKLAPQLPCPQPATR